MRSVAEGGSATTTRSSLAKGSRNWCLTANATSVAGLTGTTSRPYRVVYGSGSSGFLAPVGAQPGLNLTVRLLTYAFGYHLVDHARVAVNTGAGTGNLATFMPITCPSSSYKIQLPKLSGATAQPVSAGSGNWTWDLTMPNPGNVLVCYRLTVLANDGFTHFDANMQVAVGQPG